MEQRREWAIAIIGYATGIVIALAVAPPIASYLGWSFDLAEMPFWGRPIADLFVLGTGLVVAEAGYLAAKTGCLQGQLPKTVSRGRLPRAAAACDTLGWMWTNFHRHDGPLAGLAATKSTSGA